MFLDWYECGRWITGAGFTVIMYCNRKTGEYKQVLA